MSRIDIYNSGGKPICYIDNNEIVSSEGTLLGRIDGNYIRGACDQIIGSVDTFNGKTVFRDSNGSIVDNMKEIVAGILANGF